MSTTTITTTDVLPTWTVTDCDLDAWLDSPLRPALVADTPVWHRVETPSTPGSAVEHRQDVLAPGDTVLAVCDVEGAVLVDGQGDALVVTTDGRVESVDHHALRVSRTTRGTLHGQTWRRASGHNLDEKLEAYARSITAILRDIDSRGRDCARCGKRQLAVRFQGNRRVCRDCRIQRAAELAARPF